MLTRIVNDEEALLLSQKEESHFFDRKAVAISGRGIQKISAGFGNADGGEFVVGIADDKEEADPKKRWQGADKIEHLNSHLQAMSEISPSLDLRYEFLKCESKPGYVLRVQIEKSSNVHKTPDETIYVRQGAQTLPLKDPEKIMALAYAKGATSFEDRITKDIPPEQIIESKELRSFLHDYSPKTDPLDYCLNQNLLDYKSWDVRVVAALLFDANPSAVMPSKCAIKITRYETKEEDPEREHLAEQVTIEGPLYYCIHKTVDEIKRIMSAVNIWTHEGLKKLEYPHETIWEIVVNAVIHRDYSMSDDVHIHIFNNRIEVISPGRLPGYVNIDNILDARYARNSKIVRTLNRYKDAPNKDMGEGLNTAFQKMREWGLKNPEISEEGNYVKVILPHTPLAAPTEAIVQFLLHKDTITNQQARDITGIRSENSVKNEFYKLRDEGFLERVPGLDGPKAAWQLTRRGKEAAKKIANK